MSLSPCNYGKLTIVEKRFFIVSLHDVTACTSVQVQRQLEELAELKVDRTSLLVVPHYHGIERLDENEVLCDWLRKCQDKGHEIVLHGWRHRIQTLEARCSRPDASRRNEKKDTEYPLSSSKNREFIQISISNLESRKYASSLDRRASSVFRTFFYENLYTSGEAEFLNLDYQNAHQLIGMGLAMFSQLGLRVHGFIPPAWLMNSDVEQAVKAHGLKYTNTISELIDLPLGRRYQTRSCVWSTRAHWRRAMSRVWNGWLFRRLDSVDPLRISLHPCDIQYPAIWKQIKQLIRLAREQRESVTYADWIGKLNNP